uniref:Citrate synthase n=1 Tax=Eimeria tenella TaxID=5802 RepID=A0A8F2Z0G6_EIMTE|nr:citrate synthase [Eimeria tenella]
MLGALKGHLAPALSLAEENESRQSLRIIDERTGAEYRVPIKLHTVEAKELAAIRAPGGPPLRVFDPGLINTCVRSSRICFIDGEKGILRYRGYAIEELAARVCYEEVFFLLLFGDLPTKGQLQFLKNKIKQMAQVPEQVKSLIKSFDRCASPSSIFLAAVAALGACSACNACNACSACNACNACSPKQRSLIWGSAALQNKKTLNAFLIRAVAAGFTIAANILRHVEGLSFVDPHPDLDLVENFLYMIDGKPHDPVIVRALEVLFILHAEHELNNSTAAVLHVASSHSDIFTALAAGVAALSGRRHGGTSKAVVEMLEKIKSKNDVKDFLEKVKRREARKP